jgi:3-hydroxyacyl-[acyl-carrier-protein] dehydratase
MSEEVLKAIPHRPPFLFVDSVEAWREDGLTARRVWRADEFFYKGHYPENPITPGVLLCEAVFQAAAVYMSKRLEREGGSAAGKTPVLSRIEKARFKNMVFPGDEITIDISFKEKTMGFYFLSGTVKKGGKLALAIDFTLALLDGAKRV